MYKNLISESLLENISKRINAHHALYTYKVGAEYWENLLHASFTSVGLKSVWYEGKHTPGTDITCEDVRISCKGGSLKGSTFELTSYRTGKKKTLEEKLEHISFPHEDIIWSLAYMSDKTYRLHIFDKPNAKECEWKETFSKNNGHTGWEGINSKNGDKLTIKFSTSGQLKYHINYQSLIDRCYFVHDFVIKKYDLSDVLLSQ